MTSARPLRMPNVLAMQDLETIAGLRRLCLGKIENARGPVERRTYQKLLDIIDLRLTELRGAPVKG